MPNLAVSPNFHVPSSVSEAARYETKREMSMHLCVFYNMFSEMCVLNRPGIRVAPYSKTSSRRCRGHAS